MKATAWQVKVWLNRTYLRTLTLSSPEARFETPPAGTPN
jgi:hypothetical protein